MSDGVSDVTTGLEWVTKVLGPGGGLVESVIVGFAVDVIALVGFFVTGHTVVEIAMVEVTTWVESAGQLVTVEAQLVMVTSLVV
jgi:hypothetical protein